MVAEADAEIARGESDLWTGELSQRLVQDAREMYRNGATPDRNGEQ
jgi:hypothetical protein